MQGADDRLDLLLADADEGRPVLSDGLPEDAAQRANKPKKASNAEKPDWHRKDADPNDLSLQRWGLVVPKGKDGDALLEAIAPLRKLREEEQGLPAMEYRVDPEMDADEAAKWVNDVYDDEKVHVEDRPLYLLLLGDLLEVSLELQHTVANCANAGRVHFTHPDGTPDLDAYAAYANKVVELARKGTPEASPDLLFFVADDGTKATVAGRHKLVNPSLETSKQRLEKGRLGASSVTNIEAETVDELLEAGAGARPSVLLSVSHGLGAPRRGWKRDEDQWRRQGALVIRHDEIVDAERMRGQTFLPGGLWYCLACFGAGTPSTSAYKVWLSELAKGNAFSGDVKSVLDNLPRDGSPPFVAAMPQAALANPAGPLAVIGHMDLAWTFGFTSADDPAESRASRILSVLETMVRGSRAGVALSALMDTYRTTNDNLMKIYERAKIFREEGKLDPTDPVRRAQLWMLRNDLRGYVLLGDPAARLPLRQHALGAEARAPAERAPEVATSPAISAPTPATAVAGALLDREAAIRALFFGDETPRAIAARAGVSLETLWSWFDAYREGGRARLGG